MYESGFALQRIERHDHESDCGACCSPIFVGHWAVLDAGEWFCGPVCASAKREALLRALLGAPKRTRRAGQ